MIRKRKLTFGGKFFLLLPVILFSAFFILGCSKKKDEKILIRWWDGPTMVGLPGQEEKPTDSTKDYHLKLARQFEAMHPEVEVEVTIYGWWEIRNKIKIALMAGGGPDIGYDGCDVLLNYAHIGAIEPVDDFLTDGDLEDYFPEVIERATFKDHIWYFPFDSSSPSFICVNKKIFRDRNAEHLLKGPDEEPWTFEEFIEAAKAVTYDKDGDGLIDVWGFGMQFKEDAGYGRNAFLWGSGANIFSEDGKNFALNSPEAQAGLKLLFDLEHEYKILKPGGTALTNIDLQNAWLRGQIAMVPNLATIADGIEENIKDGVIKPGDIDIYATPYPRAEGKDSKTYLSDDGVCVFRQKDPHKKKLVMEFARFITNAEHQKERNPHVKMYPVRKSAGDVYRDDPWMQRIESFRKYAASDPSHPIYTSMRRVLLPMYQYVMINEKTPAEALADAEKRANRILQKESLR